MKGVLLVFVPISFRLTRAIERKGVLLVFVPISFRLTRAIESLSL